MLSARNPASSPLDVPSQQGHAIIERLPVCLVARQHAHVKIADIDVPHYLYAVAVLCYAVAKL